MEQPDNVDDLEEGFVVLSHDDEEGEEEGMELSDFSSRVKQEAAGASAAEGVCANMLLGLGSDIVRLICRRLPIRDVVRLMSVSKKAWAWWNGDSVTLRLLFYDLLARDFLWMVKSEGRKMRYLNHNERKYAYYGPPLWTAADFPRLYRLAMAYERKFRDCPALPAIARLFNTQTRSTTWVELFTDPKDLVLEAQIGDSIQVDTLWYVQHTEKSQKPIHTWTSLVRWSYGPLDVFRLVGGAGHPEPLRTDRNRIRATKCKTPKPFDCLQLRAKGKRVGTLELWRVPPTVMGKCWYSMNFFLSSEVFKTPSPYPKAATASGVNVEPALTLKLRFVPK